MVLTQLSDIDLPYELRSPFSGHGTAPSAGGYVASARSMRLYDQWWKVFMLSPEVLINEVVSLFAVH